MTIALSAHHPGAVISDVTILMRDDGTNRRARLGLTYSAGSGPATVFVKAVDPAHKELIKLTSGLLHEPRLFAGSLQLPIEHPRVFATAIDEAAEDFILVMEDLAARDADARDATRPMSPVAYVDWPGCTATSGEHVASPNWRRAGSSPSCRGRVWSSHRCTWQSTPSETQPLPRSAH
jgi:hypothetical protein